MFDVVLYQPEIPPNTGNIIRLCANSGCSLHLIEPLGFELKDKQLRRAGLDYHEFAPVKQHPNFDDFLGSRNPGQTIWAFSTKATQPYTEVSFAAGDALMFGPETRGLPLDRLATIPQIRLLKLPMLPESRSLNLSNTVAIVVYEAWRQLGFQGAV